MHGCVTKIKLARFYDLRTSTVRVLIPVTERALASQSQAGAAIRRLVIERLDNDEYRLVVFIKEQRDPLTVARYRGGIRTFAQVQSAIRFVEKLFPDMASCELFLKPSPSGLDAD